MAWISIFPARYPKPTTLKNWKSFLIWDREVLKQIIVAATTSTTQSFKMGKPKVTAKKIMYIAAVQIVLTTVGFILYKRPYLWAWASLEYYKEIVCGDQLDSINAKFLTYSTEYQAQVVDKINKFRRNCNEAYLESFTEKFHDWCLG